MSQRTCWVDCQLSIQPFAIKAFLTSPRLIETAVVARPATGLFGSEHCVRQEAELTEPVVECHHDHIANVGEL